MKIKSNEEIGKKHTKPGKVKRTKKVFLLMIDGDDI